MAMVQAKQIAEQERETQSALAFECQEKTKYKKPGEPEGWYIFVHH